MDKTNIANLSREARVTETARIGIVGMTCDSCVQKVEGALRGLPGVKEVSVDRAQALATVTYDDSVINVPAMHDALLKSGYKPVAESAG
jgi:Cu+-exporting ATPase